MVAFGLFQVLIKVRTCDYGHIFLSYFHPIEPIQRRYIRNPNEEEFNDGKMLTFVGTEERYDDQSFVPVEIKAGTRSQSNNSKMQVSIWLRWCSSDSWSGGP